MIFAIQYLWNRLQLLRENDRGMTTEAIVVTALLVAAAIAVIEIIRRAIEGEAEETETEIEGVLSILRG